MDVDSASLSTPRQMSDDPFPKSGIVDTAASEANSVELGGPILLFDGVCNLCHRTVQFTLNHERTSDVRFCALQSELGRKLLKQHGLPETFLESVVWIEANKAWIRSDAVLGLAKHLKAPWNKLTWARWIPRFLRDAIYRCIANGRYRWFGKRDACQLPTPDLRKRMLD